MSATAIIVDDSAYARAVIRRALDAVDIRVVAEASSAAEALRLTQEHAPDIVTLDYDLPGASAIETTRGVCRACPTARVIMVSALGDRQTILRAVQAGAHEFLVKPVDAPRLRAVIEALLSAR